MEISLKGKRIIVTGAGRGIGRDLCVTLAKCGADVIAVSKTESNLVDLKKLVPSITTVSVDLGDWNAVRKAIEPLTSKPIHGLVNNAGVAVLEPFLEAKPESFDQSFNINVKAVMNISQIVGKHMVDRKEGGAIVNISSQASQIGMKDHAIYCATKAALDSLTKTMAAELGPHQIRVNSVNPTVIMTDMGKIHWSKPENATPMLSKIPMGRFGEVREVVEVVVFLLSNMASMVNGAHLPIDGGYWASA